MNDWSSHLILTAAHHSQTCSINPDNTQPLNQILGDCNRCFPDAANRSAAALLLSYHKCLYGKPPGMMHDKTLSSMHDASTGF